MPCVPKAFCTGLTPRWYWKAEREVRRKTREKLDMVKLKSAEPDERELREWDKGNWAMAES